MKKIAFALLILFTTACSFEKKESQTPIQINVSGSNTVFPIIQKVSDQYANEKKHISIQIFSAGSNTGFEKLKTNQTDLATSSRKIKEKELDFFETKGVEIKEEVIAYDALAIITHPSNPVEKLSLEQVKKIFSGEIKNWSEVGGRNQEILIIQRDGDKSGTHDFFNEFILEGKSLSANKISLVRNEEIIKRMQHVPEAISYMGYGYLKAGIKTIALASKDEKYYYPEKHTIQNQLYPIIRPLFIYYSKENKRKVYPFIQYILSEKGQALVEQANYIPRKVIEKSYLYLPPI